MEIHGLSEIVNALKSIPSTVRKGIEKAGREIGGHCVREAKANAPISPTKTIFSKTLKRKKRTSRRQFMPGGLEKSIQYELLSDGGVSIFVASNSPAGKYAKRIHDEKGKSWHNRGPGTIAKGARADEKFIERAINDNRARYFELYKRAINEV